MTDDHMTRDELLMELGSGVHGVSVRAFIHESGFALVPIEPTFEMIEDAICINNPVINVYNEQWTAQECHDDLRARYKAMLNAAEEG